MYPELDGQGSAKRRKIELSSPSGETILPSEPIEPTGSQTNPNAQIQELSSPAQKEDHHFPYAEDSKSCQLVGQGTVKGETKVEEGRIWPAAQVEDRSSVADGATYDECQSVGSKRKLQEQATNVIQESQDGRKRPNSAIHNVSDHPLPGAIDTVSEVGRGGMEVDSGLSEVGEPVIRTRSQSKALEATDLKETPEVPMQQVVGEEPQQQKPLPGLGLAGPAVNEGGLPTPQAQLSNGHVDGLSLPPASGKLSSINATNEKLDSEYVRAGEANEGNETAEWQLDSSDVGSSSSSDDTSTDSYSTSDSEDVDDYKLLDPEEQARILMQGEGGSDDDENGKRGKAGGGQLRTKNEKPDEKVHKPKISVTSEMKIEELGAVESLVENLVVIGAKTSGEYKVLETGSVLCLEDRSVIGVVAETLGRVHQPLYSVRFTNAAEIAEAGIEKGSTIYYVEEHSTFVFTEPLKAFKGSDASNLHDEEVADDEMEFSDDEAEAEYKKRVKQERQAKRDSRIGVATAPTQARNKVGPRQERSNYNPNPVINYDDVDDELYTPLVRPPNLHEIRAPGERPHNTRAMRGNHFRGDVSGAGRGSIRGGHRGHDTRGGRSSRGDRRGGSRGHHTDRQGESSGDNPFRSTATRDIWGHRNHGSHDASKGGFPAAGRLSYDYEQCEWVEGETPRPTSAQSLDYHQSSMPPPPFNPNPLYSSPPMRSFHLPPSYSQMQEYAQPGSQDTHPRESFYLPSNHSQMQYDAPPPSQDIRRSESFHLPQNYNPAEPYSHFYKLQKPRPNVHATPLPPPEPIYNYNQGPHSAGGSFPAGAYVNPAFYPNQQQQTPMHPLWTQAPPPPSHYSDRYQSSREPPPANWGPGPPFQRPPPNTPWSSQQHSPTIPAQQVKPYHGGLEWSPTANETMFSNGQWSPPEQQMPNERAPRSWYGVNSPNNEAAFEDVQKQLNILKSLNGAAKPFEPGQQQ
ncbi:MAG: hypothetical protein M1836_005933 [Candelina mexicana]|nr:MAG: hypothetical protein M1836_005933 [Candelina mexicana]